MIPRAAVAEIQRGGALDPSVQALVNSPWIVTVDPGAIFAAVAALKLGTGESAVLSHAFANPGSGVILDDRAARKAALALGLPVQGTLGLILMAKRIGLVQAARPILEQLRQQGMFLSDKLLSQALAQVGE